MAENNNQEGDEVLLGGPIGSKLKGLLTFVDAATTDTDDVHIILEYPEGAEWAGQKAERANRFILSPDISLEAAKGGCICVLFVYASVFVCCLVASPYMHLCHPHTTTQHTMTYQCILLRMAWLSRDVAAVRRQCGHLQARLARVIGHCYI